MFGWCCIHLKLQCGQSPKAPTRERWRPAGVFRRKVFQAQLARRDGGAPEVSERNQSLAIPQFSKTLRLGVLAVKSQIVPMSQADFVHLHLHTEYSLLDGAYRLVDKAHEGNCRLPKWERRVSFPLP
jgi:hypothetical protein